MRILNYPPKFEKKLTFKELRMIVDEYNKKYIEERSFLLSIHGHDPRQDEVISRYLQNQRMKGYGIK